MAQPVLSILDRLPGGRSADFFSQLGAAPRSSGTTEMPEWWNTSGLPVTQPGAAQPGAASFMPSNIGRNVALLGTGIQALGALGETLYGGRVARKQGEEDRRATAKANLISILSKGSIAPAASVIDSSALTGSKFMTVLGKALSTGGTQWQTFREQEATLKNAEQASIALAKRTRIQEEAAAQAANEVSQAKAKEDGKAQAFSVFTALQRRIGPDNPEYAEKVASFWENRQSGKYAKYMKNRASTETLLPLVMDAIAEIETGHVAERGDSPYQAKGPRITYEKSLYYDEQALGKYQIMPGNLASWGKEHPMFNREITAEEFINNPQTQEMLAKFKLEKYIEENLEDGYGDDPVTLVKRVAAKWQSGRYENHTNETLSDSTATSVGKTVNVYAEEVYDSIKNRIDENDPTSTRFSEDFAEKYIEYQDSLALLTSGEIRQHIKNSEISPELSDYYTGGYQTEIGRLRADLYDEMYQAQTIFAREAQHEETIDIELRNLDRLDKARVYSHDIALQKHNLSMQKQAADMFIQIHQNFKTSGAYKGWEKFSASYSKLQGLIAKIQKDSGGQWDEIERPGLDDISLINTFQRLIDEATVRDNDVGLYQVYTPDVVDSIRMKIAGIEKGGGLLPASAAKDMMLMADALRDGYMYQMGQAARSEVLAYASSPVQEFLGKNWDRMEDSMMQRVFIAERSKDPNMSWETYLQAIENHKPLKVGDLGTKTWDEVNAHLEKTRLAGKDAPGTGGYSKSVIEHIDKMNLGPTTQLANQYIEKIKEDPTARYPTVGGKTIQEQPNAEAIQAEVTEYTNSLEFNRFLEGRGDAPAAATPWYQPQAQAAPSEVTDQAELGEVIEQKYSALKKAKGTRRGTWRIPLNDAEKELERQYHAYKRGAFLGGVEKLGQRSPLRRLIPGGQ